MAKIALLVNEFGSDKARVVAAIRQATSLPIAEILSRSRSAQPMLEVPTFGLDMAERVAALRDLVADLVGAGASVEMFELMSGESLADADQGGLVRIDSQMLENMVAAHQREARHHAVVVSSEVGDDDG